MSSTTDGSMSSIPESRPFLGENRGSPPRLRRGRSDRELKMRDTQKGKRKNLAEARDTTNLRSDLQTRMLQATLRLARRSFECAKTEKGTVWFKKILRWLSHPPSCLPETLSQYMYSTVPNLRDFMRAFNLVHDWYPKLHEDVRIHRETWEGCVEEVLHSMSNLLESKDISDEDSERFMKWAEDLRAKHYAKLKHDKKDRAQKALNSMKELLKEEVYSIDDLRKKDALLKFLEDITVKPDKDIKLNYERMETDLADNGQFLDEAETTVLCGNAYQKCKRWFRCDEDRNFEIVRQNLQAMYALICGPDVADSKAEDNLLLALKFPFLRVMWIILMLDFFFMYEASALGMLTQIFLELNIDIDEKSSNLRIVPLIALPILVLLYSIIGAMLADLTHGSFQYPPFKIARARLIVMLTPWLSNKNILHGDGLASCPIRFIDFFLTDGLLIFTLCGALLFLFDYQLQGEDSLSDCILNGLNSGALFWTACCVALSAFSRVWCNLWLEYKIEKEAKKRTEQIEKEAKKRTEQGNLADADDKVLFRPTRCAFILKDAFQTYGILPGETWTYFLSLQRFLEIHQHDDAIWNAQQVPEWIAKEDAMEVEEAKKNQKILDEENLKISDSWKAYSSKIADSDSLLEVSRIHRGWKFVVLSIIVWLVTGLVCFGLDWYTDYQHKGWVLLSANTGMTLTVLILSIAAEWLLPNLTASNVFRVHGIVFLVLIYGFSWVTTEFSMEMDSKVTHLMSASNTSEGTGIFYNDWNTSLVSPYPACSMSWGKNPQVRILDLAAMAYYAYVHEKHTFAELLSKTFSHKTESVHFDHFDKLPRIVAARICNNTTGPCTMIMAVKGTSTRLEVMTDLGIFSTISVLQMLDVIAPLLGTVPITVISYMIDWFRLPFMRNTQKKFIRTITNTCKELQKKHPTDSVVITGHSLGGNFAELAGATLGIPAVGFSAPGQFYMMKPFQIDRQAIAENVMTIIPSMDIVPHVAKHVDIVQRILCRRKDGKFRPPSECHSIEASSCEIWRVCGDIQRRNFSEKCLDKRGPKEAFVNESCVGEAFSTRQDAKCRMVPDR